MLMCVGCLNDRHHFLQHHDRSLLRPCRAGVRGLWAVHDAAAVAGRDLHPYLVISTASTTRVLEDSRALTGDGDDLNEVSDTCVASYMCCSYAVQTTLVGHAVGRLQVA